MTAATVLDVTSRLLACVGEASDSVSAYTQVKNGGRFRFTEVAKVRMSDYLGYVDHVLDVQNHGIKHNNLWYRLKYIYTNIHWQDYCGSDNSNIS